MNSLPARYHVIHETGYNYDSPVSLSRQQLHLTPRECPWQQSITHRLRIEPEPTFSHARFYHFGNPVSMFAIEAPHSSLVVRAESVIEVQPHLPANGLSASPPWESVRNALVYGAAPVLLEANRYRFESPYVRVKHEFNDFASHCFTPNRPLLEAVGALMSHIYNEFEFDPKATTVSTPVLKLLEERKGVCQDFAHLMLACLRSHGLAARYVSGYLLTKPPPGKPRMVGADASHAWISVYCPSAGGEFWIDFDPTNNLMPDTEHITLAWGRDFGDVSPLRGVILGGDTQEPEVAVTVTPCSES